MLNFNKVRFNDVSLLQHFNSCIVILTKKQKHDFYELMLLYDSQVVRYYTATAPASLFWTQAIILLLDYLSTVKDTKFQVEVTKPPQRRKAVFQRVHSKYPSIPSVLILTLLVLVIFFSSSIKEQNR